MATIGYIFQSKILESKNEAVYWMERLGCERIIIEESMQEKLRPEWRKMLVRLQKNDTIVITKLSHALRGIRELRAFLDLYQQYSIRLISLEDRIDTGGQLYHRQAVIGGHVSQTCRRTRRETMQGDTAKDPQDWSQAGQGEDRGQYVQFRAFHR